MLEWRIDEGYAPYPETLAAMEARVAAIRAGEAGPLVWLLEHPPLLTAGTSAKRDDLVAPDRFTVYDAGRGGQYTYHGPGQRVGYVMMDLRKGGADVRAYVRALEEWVIRALADFGVTGERRCDRPGVWVRRTDKGAPQREDKIAALGVRVRGGVSFHGMAVNVEPDLAHYGAIVPCGIREHGVTSLVDLGVPAVMTDMDMALRRHFEPVFAQWLVSD